MGFNKLSLATPPCLKLDTFTVWTTVKIAELSGTWQYTMGELTQATQAIRASLKVALATPGRPIHTAASVWWACAIPMAGWCGLKKNLQKPEPFCCSGLWMVHGWSRLTRSMHHREVAICISIAASRLGPCEWQSVWALYPTPFPDHSFSHCCWSALVEPVWSKSLFCW